MSSPAREPAINPIILTLAAAQAMWVRRRRKVVLPEAGGPTTGTTDPDPRPIRVAVLGESSAAGCGAATHGEAFAGSFARALAAREKRPVSWTVHAENGSTARHLREHILPGLDQPVDLAVLMIGANDVLRRTSEQRWANELSAILNTIGMRADQILMTGVPPFDALPVLPPTLSRYLAARGRVLDSVSQSICGRRHDTVWTDTVGLVDAEPSYFARDGFHPSTAGYQHWAEALCARWESDQEPQAA